MEIILKEYVKGLGEKGDLVSVKAGYGRNFLIPRRMADLATKAAKKIHAENVRQASHRLEHILDEAKAKGEKMSEVKIVVETLAGIEGKLFGSVTPLMIENQLKEKGFEISRKRISFSEEIKEVGSYTAIIDLHKEVKAKVSIEVIGKEAVEK